MFVLLDPKSWSESLAFVANPLTSKTWEKTLKKIIKLDTYESIVVYGINRPFQKHSNIGLSPLGPRILASSRTSAEEGSFEAEK